MESGTVMFDRMGTSSTRYRAHLAQLIMHFFMHGIMAFISASAAASRRFDSSSKAL